MLGRGEISASKSGLCLSFPPHPAARHTPTVSGQVAGGGGGGAVTLQGSVLKGSVKPECVWQERVGRESIIPFEEDADSQQSALKGNCIQSHVMEHDGG